MVKYEHNKLARKVVEQITEVVNRYFEAWELINYNVQEDMKDEWYGIVVTAIEYAEEELNK